MPQQPTTLAAAVSVRFVLSSSFFFILSLSAVAFFISSSPTLWLHACYERHLQMKIRSIVHSERVINDHPSSSLHTSLPLVSFPLFSTRASEGVSCLTNWCPIVLSLSLSLCHFAAKNLRKYVEAYMNRKDISPQLTQIKSLGKCLFIFHFSTLSCTPCSLGTHRYDSHFVPLFSLHFLFT